MRVADVKHVCRHLNWKTLSFNFRHFPFRIAYRLPVFVSSNVVLKATSGKLILPKDFKTGMIRLGFGDVGIFDRKRSRTIWELYGTAEFKGAAFIGHGSRISVGENGLLQIGTNFSITAESSIVCFHRIVIGNYCLFSWEVLMMDTDFHKIYNFSQEQINPDTPIHLGENVWIGARTTILKGAIIPSGSVVAANSVVTRKAEKENCVYGGEPIRILKEDVNWEI